MTKQILFAVILLVTLGVFSFTASRIIRFFRITKPAFPVRDMGRRMLLMFEVAFGQTKIFRRPVMGLAHALVFWGFCIILIGSIEMVIDGLAGSERILKLLGPVYDVIMAAGDVFAVLVAVSILIFLSRRLFFHIRRFEGNEMKKINHLDALIALTMILLLMVSLLGMNATYVQYGKTTHAGIHGVFPAGRLIAGLIADVPAKSLHVAHEIFWWSHILLVFIFANILPYSKHFHVFMSVPNVFLSRLEPLGKLPNMDDITREVRIMLNPGTADEGATGELPAGRFGVMDVEDVTWKNYLDALSCTQCGRCTAVCPANITGKLLSPRKVIMDVRERMKEKGPGIIKNGKEYTDQRSLLRNYITEEELWACTTCNACAQECPININHPELIVGMRRYLAMEEGSVPGELKAVFSNIENNGAPWQFSPEDR
ncbi:MAG: (Fe-S)-binding protein, partial [Bacteroidales bacterium]|nr:(Fe-S)-binding protein [Bacteroidales bacterium]